MWSDTSGSLFVTVQYKPLDHTELLGYPGTPTAFEAGLYYYHPANTIHFSLRAGGGTYHPATAYTAATDDAVFVKPGIFIVSDKWAERMHATFGAYLVYARESQTLQTIHHDPYWGDFTNTYHQQLNKLAAGIDVSFIFRVTYRLDAILSIQTSYYLNRPDKEQWVYFPGVGTINRLFTNPAIGVLYKINK
jgi:hypothetical protein